ncbi:MAG: efflux RND transporter periplasmic adaptor subunit [Syntrophobacteraceae bacterium]
MRKVGYFSLLLLSITWMFMAYSWSSWHTIAKSGSRDDRKILYYVDPMNPSNISEKPGTAPCGMAMEPVYDDEENTQTGPIPQGSVKISPQKQQLIGVRVSTVEETSRTQSFRTLGRIAPEETRVHRVIAGAPGFIREVSNVTTDSYVKKDQWLASFSSPDSIASIQAYIVALNAMDRLRWDNAERSAENLEGGATYQLRVEKLQELGISPSQMMEIKETRAVPRMINILSPVDGFVLTRDISPDQKFDRGAEWYRIANLSRVWILADVFEREAGYIKAGNSAIVSLPQQEVQFEAQVAEVLPSFDPQKRTLRVRLVVENPGFILKPDMFVDVEFLISTPPAITVPSSAVINSGIRKTVFVDLGNGFFEPREIKTGWHSDDHIQITAGLMPGEKIVLSGTFLLDSESQMKRAAARRLTAGVKDPVCGMSVDPHKARASGLTSESGGKTYFFCEPSCKANFEKNLAGKLPGEQAQTPQSGQSDSAESKKVRVRNEVAAEHVKHPHAGALIR